VCRRLLFALACIACQSTDAPSRPAPRAIEAHAASGAVSARVVQGHPCRATVEGIELLVGGRPLVAQVGTVRWTGEDAANGTTLLQNDKPVARIHAKQIFDAEGIPLLRVMDNGDIVDRQSRIVRKAIVVADGVRIGDITVRGATTGELPLAAMLTAPELEPSLRALAACHYLLDPP
jgi:hypothetical protein